MTSLDLLRNDCVNSLNREPEDATEKELGYSVAMRHIIKLIDDKYSQMHKHEIVEAFKHGELPCLFVNLNAEEYYQETFKK